MNAQADDEPRCAKSFLGHLDDLRGTLINCAISLALGMAVAVPLTPVILGFLKTRIALAGVDPDRFLTTVRLAEGFITATRIVFWAGLILSFPVMSAFVARFVFPGLTRRERAAVVRAGVFGAVLFAAGVAVGCFLTLPVAIRVLLSVNRWLGVSCSFVLLSDYIGFVMKLLLAFGIAFQFPVVLLVLGGLGILSSAQLRQYRRHAIVVLMAVAMVLTPPDVVSQVLLGVPLILLYEACIWVLWSNERRRAAA